jgi:hypothetical protein
MMGDSDRDHDMAWDAQQAQRAEHASRCCPVCRADAVTGTYFEQRCAACEAHVCDECGAWCGGQTQAACECGD